MTDRWRNVAFGCSAIVLLGVTAFLTLHNLGPRPGRDARSDQAAGASLIRTESSPTATLAATLDPSRSPSLASAGASSVPSPPSAARDEAEARDAPAVGPGEARAAVTAARAFLEDYLAYSYGRGQARRIRAAAFPLLHELETSPPRVPARVARSRARLVSMHAEAAIGDLDVSVVAVVDDGQRRYRVLLAVRDTRRGWVVTAISG